MGRLGRTTLAAAWCVALAVAPATALAASHWGPELTIFPPRAENWNRADVVVTPAGSALARVGSYDESRIRLATSTGYGPFDKRRFFTEGRPGLFSDGAGGIIAIGFEQSGRLSVRSGSVEGRFGPRQTIAVQPDTLLDAFEYDVSPRGDVYLVWATSSAFCGCLARLRATVRPAGERRFGPVQILSPPNRSAFNPRIVFDRKSNALLAWEQDYDVNRGRLAYALHPGGANSFRRTHTMHAAGSHGGVFGLDLASNPSGRAVAVWSSRAEPLRDVRAAIGTVKGGLHSVERVANGRAGAPHVAVDEGGEALASWGAPSPTVAVAEPDGEFGEPRTLQRGRSTSPVIANDGAGTYTLIWRRLPHGSLHAARRRVGSDDTRVVELDSRRVYRATLAATAGDETLVAWNLLESGSLRYHVDVTLRGARVAVARPRHGFGRPLTLSDDSWGSGFPVDRVEIAVDAVGGAFLWWRREVERGVPGHYGRFLVP